MNKYYEILNLNNNASLEDIKKAYKKLAIIYHPDKNTDKSDIEKQENEKKFKKIAEAYEILTNKEKYNHLNNNNFNINPNVIFNQLFNNHHHFQHIFQINQQHPNIYKTININYVNGKKIQKIIQNINGNIIVQEIITDIQNDDLVNQIRNMKI